MDPKFEETTKLLSKLPGIGPRHAARIVMALLDRPQVDLVALGDAITNLKDRIRQCRECFNLADGELCAICKDSRRDPKAIMVVERATDLQSVERAGLWKGLYHVLGGAISPVDQVGPEHVRIKELAERVDRFVQQTGSLELVVATNPNAAGEMTAHYLRDMFHGLPGVRVTRLARGLQTGTSLEYTDEVTLKHALDSRK